MRTRVRSELEASCAPQDATASMAEFVAQTEVVNVQLDSPEVDVKCVSGAFVSCQSIRGECALILLVRFPDLACPEGRYGANCEQECTCQNGAQCDAATGACTCALGFQGARCERPCEAGRFGPDCAYTCNCRNDATCDRVTGCCSCTSGWFGQFCELGKTAPALKTNAFSPINSDSSSTSVFRTNRMSARILRTLLQGEV